MTDQPPVHEAAHRRDWPSYFDRMEGKPARDTVLKAIALFNDNLGDIDPSNPPLAIDLGCGAGRDSVALLDAGWKVWAQDGSQDGLNRTKARPEIKAALKSGRIQITQAYFEGLQIPSATLVNASFSLPFCPPDHFQALWQQIDASIEPGGRFSGQLFGDRDDWATIEDRSHFTRTETLALFDQYILESFIEEDRPSRQSEDMHKHWHMFHIVARKR